MDNRTEIENNSFEERFKKKLEKGFRKEEKSVAGFFIKNFRFTYLIIFTIIIGGFYAILTLPKEAEPEVRVPFAVVNTIWPGATPSDTEELITEKIEDEIKNLDNLSVFNSTSGQGYSSVFVEFNAEANLKDSFQKLRDAVDTAESALPDEVEAPVVTEVNFNDIPIVTYSLVGDYSDSEMKNLANNLQEELESIKDVNRAEIIGGIEQEFQVILDQKKLINYNISLGQIANAIRSNNYNLPAGNLEIDNYKYDVRVKGKLTEAKELENIIVATYDQSPVRLTDVAVIKDGYKEKTTESFIGFPDKQAQKTISIQLYKKTGGNILNIVENSQEKIDELYKNGKIPSDIVTEKTNDNSVFVKEDLKTLGTSGIQTFTLIALLLMIVLSFRGAIITASAVPLAFLMAFVFLMLEGMTINGMVLFSLVLSLGLMVDNAIIIIEGINEYVEKHGKSIYQAAILSVWNFKWAITSGTMTTVSAFLPMLLVSGIMGEYMSILPKTISVTLLSSLFVAIVAIPTLATRFVKKNGSKTDVLDEKEKEEIRIGNSCLNRHRNKKRHIFIDKNLEKLFKIYREFLLKILPHKNKRRKLLATVWILFFLSLAVPISGLMDIEMFPDIDLEFFIVNIELPIGSTLDATKDVTEKIEKLVSQIPELDNYVINIGSSMDLGFGGGGTRSAHLANVTVNLVSKDERTRKSYEITEEIRPKLEAIQGATVRTEELAAGPPTGAPIEVRISGEDLEDLSLASSKIMDYFDTVPGVINIRDSIEEAAGEFTFTVNKQKASYYGLDTASIASTLRGALFGSTASIVNIDGDDVDITVKYNENKLNSINDLENITLFTNTGDHITLKQVAEVNLKPALLTIKHRDGKRTATVSAGLEKGASLTNILSNFSAKYNDLGLPKNINIKVGGEVEDIEKSYKELFLSMILSIILIAFILVLQFNSFKQPFLIIFSLPLAIIGVMIGLNIIGHPFSFTVFIGLVSLSGIVVNDAIVLIDRINKNILDGMEFIDAIIEGGIARMQPIFLTSVTTIAGIFPLIFSSELWRGVSVTIIFGLLFSTFLILVVVPVYFAGICSKECIQRKKENESFQV